MRSVFESTTLFNRKRNISTTVQEQPYYINKRFKKVIFDKDFLSEEDMPKEIFCYISPHCKFQASLQDLYDFILEYLQHFNVITKEKRKELWDSLDMRSDIELDLHLITEGTPQIEQDAPFTLLKLNRALTIHNYIKRVKHSGVIFNLSLASCEEIIKNRVQSKTVRFESPNLITEDKNLSYGFKNIEYSNNSHLFSYVRSCKFYTFFDFRSGGNEVLHYVWYEGFSSLKEIIDQINFSFFHIKKTPFVDMSKIKIFDCFGYEMSFTDLNWMSNPSNNIFQEDETSNEVFCIFLYFILQEYKFTIYALRKNDGRFLQ